MRLSDATAVSATNLSRRKGRTVLTVVGVVIGVAALVLMVSLAIGLEREVLRLLKSEDSLRTIFCSRVRAGGAAKTGGHRPMNFVMFGVDGVPITDRDLEDLKKLPGVSTVIPELNLMLNLEFEGEPQSKQHFVPIGGLPDEEVQAMRRYIVAGDVWKHPGERAMLIPSRMLRIRMERKPEDVIGRKMVFSRAFASDEDDAPRTEDVTYTVAGVVDTERLGIMARHFYLPMPRALELREIMKGGVFAYKKGAYLAAEVKAKDATDVPDLKKRLQNSGYETLTASDIASQIGTVFLVIEGFMAAIGAIGLLVSIFGIANTMAMAVLERTREIGIMKAIGARNRDIRRIFLLEAAAIGLVGGLVGLAAGMIGGAALNLLAHHATEIPPEVRLFHVSLWLAAGALVFSVFVSVLAGLAPAVRASRLDPVQALRYE